MLRQIIEIDESKCNGCGLCATACHEGAIAIIDGKAKLTRDDYCDGMGDCLPNCPMDAIHFIEKDTLAYDEAAVEANKLKKAMEKEAKTPVKETAPVQSELTHWPCQIKLVSVNASCLDGCDLLIAADCTAYAYGNFHRDFIKDHVCLVGCPKLDSVDYSEKLSEIFKQNNIKSVTLTRMTVPCCGGMENAIKKALNKAGKTIPYAVAVINPAGEIVKRYNY